MEGESLEESNVGGGGNVKVERKKQSVKAAAAPLCCPRCESTNTKFCYYNNYSKLQPRHYCRDCRRHWTNGGTLRDVPVGGSQKRKRGSPGGKHADVVAGAQSPLTPPEATEDNYSRSGGMSTTGGASFSSLFYDNAGQQDGFPGDGDGDGLFAMATTTRHPSPASNLSQWDDIIDLVTMELKPPPTSERVDHTFTY